MLHIVPTRWYSWDVTVSDGSRPVANIVTSWMREKGAMTVEGRTYRVSREGLMSGDFVLEQPGGTLARAEKTSVFGREMVIRHAGRSYTLRPGSFWGRSFVLFEGSRQIGSIAPTGVLTRKAAADLPHHLPLPVRMFIVWLTMIAWKRRQSS
jgi:hypothetical protein